MADATDRPPATITAPDGSGEIFWRKGEDKEDPLDWVMWFRDLKSGQETQIGKLPGFPSFEPLQIRRNKDPQFLFEGPLRLTFFSCHLDSTNGTTVVAFDFNKRKLIRYFGLEPEEPKFNPPAIRCDLRRRRPISSPSFASHVVQCRW